MLGFFAMVCCWFCDEERMEEFIQDCGMESWKFGYNDFDYCVDFVFLVSLCFSFRYCVLIN